MSAAFRRELMKIEDERQKSKIAGTFAGLKTKLAGRPLVLYGAGRLGALFLDFCREYGVTVVRVCDRGVTGVLGGEVEIINPPALRRDFSHAAVLVCSGIYNDEICDTLRQMGFPPEQIIPYPFEYTGFISLRQFDDYIKGYEWVYDFFADGRSKQLVLDRLRMYLTGRRLEPNTDCDIYYEEGFSAFGKHEVFVDGGAYTGDSAEVFLDKSAKIIRGGYTACTPLSRTRIITGKRSAG